MEDVRLSRGFELTPWGLLLIWWGILELTPTRPKGIAPLGAAVILLGVNALRIVNGSTANRFSVTLESWRLF